MNPTPLELIGSETTPTWVRRAMKEALLIEPIDSLYWANVMLMSLRQAANDRALDEAKPKEYTMRPFNPGRVDPNS